MPAKSLITDSYVNTNRQFTLDIMKSLSILFMVLIHTLEELSIYDIGESEPTFFTKIIEFLGGPLAAPVFMFCMGIGMVYSKHREDIQLIKRGIFLWILGYILNFARALTPMLTIGIIADYWEIFKDLSNYFNIDILMFAGLSFVLTGILKKIKVPLWGMGIIAVFMQIVGNAIHINDFSNPLVEYGLGLFVYTSEWACFPLLLWYVYPVAGIIAAKYLKQTTDLDRLNRILILFGGVITAGFVAGCYNNNVNLYSFFTLTDEQYYRQDFFRFIFNIAIIAFVAGIMYFIGKRIKCGQIVKLIKLMSSRLNEIYINQWLIIGAIEGFMMCEIIPFCSYSVIIPLALVILVVSTTLSGATNKIMSKIKI